MYKGTSRQIANSKRNSSTWLNGKGMWILNREALWHGKKTLICSKGQLNSEWICEVIVSSKNYRDFCPGSLLKVSHFQNEFMKSSFLPKYEPKLTIHSEINWPLEGRAKISVIFGWDFGRNDVLINSFWIQLTFRATQQYSALCSANKKWAKFKSSSKKSSPPHFLDLDLNFQKTRCSFWRWLHI